MDTTELHYITYDPEELWDEIQDIHMQCGGDVLYPGDEKEMLLRTVLAVEVAENARIDNACRMNTLRYAEGEFLDIFGETRGCERIQATPAKAVAEVTLKATGVSTVIPSGSALTSDGSVIYTLDSPINHSGAAISVDVSITCQDAGAKGNALTSGAVMQFVVSQPAVVSVKLKGNASGGMEAEDDDTYRERIREWGFGIVTTGPSASYESKAIAAASEVIDAKAVQTDAGKVGVYLLLTDEASEENVKQAVLDACNPRDIRPLTDYVEAFVADKVEYNLTVQYQLEAGSLADAASLQAAVDEYKDWQNNTLGRPFNPDKLVAELFRAGASHVVFKTGSTFNSGEEIKYTEIEPTQRCYGEVTLEVLS